MNWQPIETAPKDDSVILVYDGAGMHVAWIGWTENEKPVYFDDNVAIRPTHWMPLPEPPK